MPVNRYEWLKGVLQAASLNASDKALASALAVAFFNEKTRQLNPSPSRLAFFLGVSEATVRRSRRALAASGWLCLEGGGGRGNFRNYILTSPGKVVPIQAAKIDFVKGCKYAHREAKRGSDLHKKGYKSAHPYIEQYKEQIAPAQARFGKTRFSGNPFDGPIPIKSEDRDALRSWSDWLVATGHPDLSNYHIHVQGYVLLPFRRAPSDERREIDARDYFAALAFEVEDQRELQAEECTEDQEGDGLGAPIDVQVMVSQGGEKNG